MLTADASFFYVDAAVAHRNPDSGMAEQNPEDAKVAGCFSDDRHLRPKKQISFILFRA